MMSDLKHPIHDLEEPRYDVMKPSLIGRRKSQGEHFGARAALFAGAESASAFLFRKSAALEVKREKLPAVWVKQQGKNLDAYIDFLARLNLENITLQQIIDAHAKIHGGVWNQLPHSSLWKNISPTLKAVDRIAGHLKVPVKEIVSAYRAPAYNARCAGARRASWHQTNYALDVSFSVRASVVTRTARDLRSKGLFRGGVGGYSGFTHIDSRGTNIDW
jgi:hypothetical protein